MQVSWKAKLKEAFPNPNDYAEFMGSFSSATGAVTLGMMLLGQRIFKVAIYLLTDLLNNLLAHQLTTNLLTHELTN